jgi:hypothetical protein
MLGAVLLRERRGLALMSASRLADGGHDWVVLGADGAGVKA